MKTYDFKGVCKQAKRRPTAKVLMTAALMITITIGSPEIVNAILITETINFTATNFTSELPEVLAPQDPVSGSFTLTYDPLLPSATGSLSNIALNIVGHDYTLAEVGFATNSVTPPNTTLFIEGLLNGVFVSFNTNDFVFSITTTAPRVAGPFSYAVLGTNSGFTSTTTTVTTGPVTAPIPEPSSWLLLGSGLVALAFARKKLAV
jgi:PEP-CTERM motif-containing protein